MYTDNEVALRAENEALRIELSLAAERANEKEQAEKIPKEPKKPLPWKKIGNASIYVAIVVAILLLSGWGITSCIHDKNMAQKTCEKHFKSKNKKCDVLSVNLQNFSDAPHEDAKYLTCKCFSVKDGMMYSKDKMESWIIIK